MLIGSFLIIKIRRPIYFGLRIFLLFIFSSCATIIHTPYQNVTIVAHPKNTDIYINHQYYGKDSVKIKLKRNSNAYIEFKNEYCIHKEIMLIPQNSKGGAFLYILDSVGGLLSFLHPIVGGLAVFIPVSVDFITGSHHTLNPYSKSAKDFTLSIDLQNKCPD